MTLSYTSLSATVNGLQCWIDVTLQIYSSQSIAIRLCVSSLALAGGTLHNNIMMSVVMGVAKVISMLMVLI